MVAPWLLGLGSIAVAQDDPSEEIVVYGEELVEQARREVVEQLEEIGYDYDVIDLGDRVVYRHRAAWHGEVVLYDEGYMKVRRQPLHAEGRPLPWAKRNSPGAWAGCLLWPWACVRVYGATVSDRKWRSRESRTVQRVEPKVRTWANRVADLAVYEKIQGLPERLEALWERGQPLQGEGRLESYADRRAALLAFWGSRTETVWGREVQRAVRGFLRSVVQESEHPFTTAELATFNAEREVRLEL